MILTGWRTSPTVPPAPPRSATTPATLRQRFLSDTYSAGGVHWPVRARTPLPLGGEKVRICHTLPLTGCLFVTIILLECPITSQRAMHRKPINPLHRRGQIIRLPWEIRKKLKGRASQFRRSDQIKAEAISGNGDGGGSLAAGPKSFEPAELAEQENGESSRRSDQIKPKAKSAAENQRGGAAQIQAEAESRSRACETDFSLTPAPSVGGCPSSGLGP